ncbi:MAG: flagellar biosynthesis protein FlhB [Rhizobiales bacterium]|nr:flagellar biosynthesis protein FlhB [Hyphomicrobiales bacterium]
MSDETDQESKTEHATEKRIRDSLEKGNIPFSKEAVTLGSIAAMLAASALIAQYATADLYSLLSTGFEHAGSIRIESPGDASGLLSKLAVHVGVILVPMLLLLAFGGILGGSAQNMPSANLERLTPKFERISPKKNFSQFYGKAAALEAATTSVKLAAAGGVAYWTTKQLFGNVIQFSISDPSLLLGSIGAHVNTILSSFTLLCIAIAVLDVVMVRMRWSKKLMMTRQEVKDELKQSEGDPLVKQRMQLLGRSRRRGRMMADVPRATMVVVNPTHFAVAMRYVAAEGGAPVVVAKGMDHLALKIREVCEENRIPIVENPPLARALHKSVAVGSMIPAEFYRAVAEIIHFVELRRRMKA